MERLNNTENKFFYTNQIIIILLFLFIFITILFTQFFLPFSFEILLIITLVFSSKISNFLKQTIF